MFGSEIVLIFGHDHEKSYNLFDLNGCLADVLVGETKAIGKFVVEHRSVVFLDWMQSQ